MIVEVLNEDGTMARRDDLMAFAREHGIKIGTIADLIAYRVRNERTVERVADCELPTSHGRFHLYAYQDVVDGALHFALVRGRPRPEDPVLVRVHIQNTLSDLFDATGLEQSWPLRPALEQLGEEETAVVVMLRRPSDATDVLARMRDYQRLQAGQIDETQGGRAEGEASQDLRTYGVGAQILTDLGVRRMRVLSSPKRMHGLSGFGMEVVEYIEPER
ncbi:Riboflavin biosynthesis protein RibBA [wastewater metagenome]|uniref:Riboflavin biosynthesis protein RibBA n=2 Tax=unclassified sequences TaxID=12908 RepID=A0A6A7SKB2_9ZZZZ|nr:riboflavin biosynthesis protein RibBA [uncultured organism]QEA07975.1 riboflavin biosynthesis protein RibBA [uncultured organism]